MVRSSRTEERIAWAEECCRTLGSDLLKDAGFRRLLARLQAALDGSRAALRDTGIALECRRCEEEEGGSCCGAGLELHYDGPLLLINLLLQAELPPEPLKPGSCWFLGAAGCLLKARHTLCVNYLCRNLENRLAPGPLSYLREKEGEEQVVLFQLVERLRALLMAERPLPNGPGPSGRADNA